MKKIFTYILILITLTFCCDVCQAKKALSNISRQQLQTYYYNTGDTQKVAKAIIDTLHESGYIIEDYDQNLGFIRASKSIKRHYVTKKRVAGWSTVLALTTAYTVFSYGSTVGMMIDPTWRVANELKDKTVIIDSNVNIEKISNTRTKVRFVYSQKILQNADGHSFTKSAPLVVIKKSDKKVYHEFFTQIDKKLFEEI